ncbi:MAG: DUF6438 domain-containing protein [Gemmatimonadaceae bacterium]
MACSPDGDWLPGNHFRRTTIVSRPTALRVVDTASVRIRLARSMCLGRCPVYSVEITGDGEVTYDGGLNVAYGGREQATISRREVAGILAHFERLDYFSLPKLDSESCFDVTDSPSAITFLSFDNRSTSVDHYRGCGKAPHALHELEDAIDSITGTNRWIEPPPRAPGSVSTPPPDETMRRNSAATVAVTSWWHLVEAQSGKPVHQRWVATPDVEGGRALPAIVVDSIGFRKPLLSLEDSSHRAIDGSRLGFGVLISEEGTLVTSGDLVSGWRLEFDGTRDGETAIITDSAGRVRRDSTGAAETGYTSVAWRPASGGPGVPDVRGVLDSIVVELKDGRRLLAHLVAFSRDTAVATLRVYSPRSLPTAEVLTGLLTPGDSAWAHTGDPADYRGPSLPAGIIARVGGAVAQRWGVGEENQFERYLWSPTLPSNSEPMPLGTPFFDSQGRLAGLRVRALLHGEFPEFLSHTAIAALRAVAGSHPRAKPPGGSLAGAARARQ